MPGIGTLHGAAALVFDADRASAVEQDTAHQRFGHDFEVGPFRRRTQIGARGAAAPSAAAGLLAPADAVAGAGGQVVHVIAVFEADLAARLDCRRAQQRPVHLRGKERTALAADFGFIPLPVLGLPEIRQHIVPTPATVAELGPVVEILGLAADIDQPVDRARPAEHAPARIEDRAPGGAGVGLGVISPGQGRVIEHFHKAGGDMDVRAPVAPASLDQQDLDIRVLG